MLIFFHVYNDLGTVPTGWSPWWKNISKKKCFWFKWVREPTEKGRWTPFFWYNEPLWYNEPWFSLLPSIWTFTGFTYISGLPFLTRTECLLSHTHSSLKTYTCTCTTDTSRYFVGVIIWILGGKVDNNRAKNCFILGANLHSPWRVN